MSRVPVRRRLVAVAAATTALAIVLLLVAFVVVLEHQLRAQAETTLRQRSAAALATVTASGGRLRLLEGPGDTALDGNVWVYRADGTALETATGPPPVQAAAASLAGAGTRSTVQLSDPDVVLRAAPVLVGGQRRGTVVVALSTESYRKSAVLSSATLAGAGAVVLLGVVVLSWLLVRAALRPVVTMTGQAAQWSEQDLDRRFRVGPVRDELSALAATLDGLLDRLAAAMRHEQRLSAELAHELRTPLAVMRSEVDIALRRPRRNDELQATLRAVQQQTVRMGAVIDVLMVAAEREADPHSGRGDLRAALFDAVATARDEEAPHPVAIDLRVAEDELAVPFDTGLAVQVLNPLLHNAVRHAGAQVLVSAATREGWAEVVVDDDGEGIGSAAPEALFAPGERGESRRGPGAGLGLALSRRLARSVGGDVTLDPGSGAGGAVVRVRLPLLDPPPVSRHDAGLTP